MGEIKYGIAWSDDYKLGNGKVDAQHRRLFELVSDLVGSCVEGSGEEKVKEALDFLVDYTIQHFIDEEALQLEYGYPEYESHRQLHEEFKGTVGAMISEYENTGSSQELGDNVNKTIVRWLINHIQREDKKIADHIRKMKPVKF